MRKLIVLLTISMCSYNMSGQIIDDQAHKPKYIMKYKSGIVEYHTTGYYINDFESETKRLDYYIYKDFETLDDLLNFLNQTWSSGKKGVNIHVERVIYILDLTNSEKIEFEFVEEEKSREREVVIEEEKWVDKYYKLKNQ